MRMIILGEKNENIKYDFRESCYGIYVKNNKILVTFDPIFKQYTLIGGGIEYNETKHDCIRREFIEEVGLKIKRIKHYVTIDCFWTTIDNTPLESLTHFYFIDIDKKININSEGIEEYINMDKSLLPLPYQKKVIELLLKEYKK